jgi:site-specific DNA-cytosine methylase
MKIFSTFTGIGGFEIGITDAAVGRCNVEFIGYSEIDKYAIQVYEKQFKGVKILMRNYGRRKKMKPKIKSNKWYGRFWPPERRKVKIMQAILDSKMPEILRVAMAFYAQRRGFVEVEDGKSN